jgi:hypothetical protein
VGFHESIHSFDSYKQTIQSICHMESLYGGRVQRHSLDAYLPYEKEL